MSANYFAGPNPPDATELRVLGSLLEKRRTVPDGYPLSVNSLRLACNQATNREPVVEYDEQTVLAAAERLGRRGWIRFSSGRGSRARKYRHILDEALELGPDEEALLCVLMLRGAQTPGELKQRTERLHRFADLAELDGVLDRLVERELVAALPRRPGQKEQRFLQLLSGDEEEPTAPTSTASVPASAPAAAPAEADTDRLDMLELELADLRDQVAQLRDLLGG